MNLSPLYLKKAQVAELLATTPANAARLLAERGCKPVDYGRGRSLGLRWYAPEVSRIAQEMHDAAQAAAASGKDKLGNRGPVKIRPGSQALIQGRSINDLYAELTGNHTLQ